MNNITDSLLGGQKIGKRKYSSPARERNTGVPPRRVYAHSQSKPAFRPAGVTSLFERNSKIIEKINQKPSGDLRRQIHGRKESFSRPVSVSGRRGHEKGDERNTFLAAAGKLVTITALFALVIGGAFIIYSQGGSFDWTSREVVGAEKDSGSQYNLALYAGVNPAENPAASASFQPEEIPLDLTEVFDWQTYKVVRGDSVSKIAALFSVSMDAIIASNEITNARGLREGETLRIPNMDGIPYTVKSGDSLFMISRSMGVPLEAILDANDIQSDVISAGTTLFIPGARMNGEDLKLALGELFIYPVNGARLSSPFGWRNDPISGVRRHHAAVDLSAPQGTPIKAAMDGRISALGFNATYGNYIIITHSGGFQTMYAHLYSFSMKNGDRVVQGTQIGTVGSTGYSTGPHLHFAVYKNNRAVNPLDFLGPRS